MIPNNYKFRIQFSDILIKYANIGKELGNLVYAIDKAKIDNLNLTNHAIGIINCAVDSILKEKNFYFDQYNYFKEFFDNFDFGVN